MRYLEQFYKHLKDTYHSKGSIKTYYYSLRRTRDYFCGNNLNDDKTITEKDILNFIDYLKESDLSPVTYYRRISCLKAYFVYLEEKQIIFINPMMNIELPKMPISHFNSMTIDEVKNIIDKIGSDSDNDIRIKMILEVLYSSAIRPKELLKLKIPHIDFTQKIIFIEQGKGKKDRVVPIGSKACEMLKKYIVEVRVKYIKDKENNYLLIPFKKNSERLCVNSLNRIITETCIKYSIKQFNAYSLRFSCAEHLLQNGVSIFFIQKLLGHSDPKTTQIYLKVRTVNLKNELTKKHPHFNFKN